MFADHVDRSAARLDAGIDDDALAGVEAVDALSEGLDEARSVGAEDARLRDGGETFADPDVEVVQRGSLELDENLALARSRIGRLFEDENLGAAVLMDPHCAHRGRLSL